MGLWNIILNRIARSSNVVDTVDVIAKLFLAIRLKNPSFSNKQIYEELVRIRYKQIDIPPAKKLYITSQISDNLTFEHFAYAVLVAELDIHQTGEGFRTRVWENMQRVLDRYPTLPK